MSTTSNYKHLYYFWVVAKEGGISRAAEKLGIAEQTVSAQVRQHRNWPWLHRETLNKATFCGEPAQLCDAGPWQIKGLLHFLSR